MKSDDLINSYLTQEMIDLANDFSHDIGSPRSREQLLELRKSVEKLLEKIIEKMRIEDDEDLQNEDEFKNDLE
jgi:hypothetical protein